MYFYYNKSGIIKMISEKKIKTNLDAIRINPTMDESEKLKGGYIVGLENGKLKFDEHPRARIRGVEAEKKLLKSKVEDGSLTMVDIGNFITKYL